MATALRHVRYVRFVPLTEHTRWGASDFDGARYLVPTLWCPGGHEFRTNMILQEGNALAACDHREHASRLQRRVCGITLLLVGGCRTPEGVPAIYYAQVLPTEVATLGREGHGPAAMMAQLDRYPYLGAHPRRSD